MKRSPAERAEELLSQMSLEEKMGQIVGFYPSVSWSKTEFEQTYPQGAGQIACFGMRELDTLEQAAEYQRLLQDQVMELSDHRIPAIFHMEGLCGILVKDGQSFPSGIGRASTWNPELEYRVGRIAGTQASVLGTAQVLAPVLDISRDSRFGRQGETYGEDPVLAASMGVAYTTGVQTKVPEGVGVGAAAKHFIGYHDSQGGIHAANCDIPYRLLREVYAKPFQAAITEGGLHSVMPCYSSLNGLPVAGSKEILTDLLRGEMGFDGIVIADYCSVQEIHDRQKVGETLTDAGQLALTAGVDMELPSKNAYNDELMKRFADGTADLEILDQAVRNILTEKFRLGLFENPYAASGVDFSKYFHTEDDSRIALQSARESMVLLKNDGLLPISPAGKKVAVIGYHAGSTRALFGGYTYMSMTERWLGARNTMAGINEQDIAADKEPEILSGSYVQKEHPLAEQLAKNLIPDSDNLLEEIRKRFTESEVRYAYGYPYAGDDMSGHEEALRIANEADLVILTLGGKYGTGSMASTGEGIDSTSINLPVCQERFIERLSGLGKPVVAVHFDGRPISSDAADHHMNAIVEAWSPAEMGARAVVDVLLGEYNPGGRLPVTVAHNAGQEPVYYNHYNGSSYHQGTIGAFTGYMDKSFEPRYFFGYGLSYTTFEYLALQLSSHATSPDGRQRISVKLRNSGTVAGDEVVQLYVRDILASMTRPVMELAGFRRIHLKPGETAEIIFTMEISQLAFLDYNRNWKVEQGDIEVLVGAASNDIRLKDSFYVTADAVINGAQRGFYACTEVVPAAGVKS